MQLSVIIVNYNVRHFLEQCLLSVRKAMEGIDGEVIVVDNNSVDGSQQMLKEKFGDEIILIENTDNPGFSKANNQGIRIAKGQHVLLLNPDTIVESATFEKCLAFMDAHPDAGALGVKMMDGQGHFLPESKRSLPTPWVSFYKIFGLAKIFPKSKTFGRYHLSFLDKDENHEIEILSGAFMWMRKEAIEKTGGLDEDFFMYGEDIDLSYRIIQAGYKNYYLADTQIIHYKGESTKKGSLNYVRVFYQAMIIFARKHFGGNKQKAFIFFIRLAVYLRAIMAVMSRGIKTLGFPLIEAMLVFGIIFGIKEYWEHYVKYIEGGAYPATFDTLAAPTYTLLFIGLLWLAGAYKKPFRIPPIINATFWGFVAIATVSYIFPNINFSRAIVGLSSIFTMIMALTTRGAINLMENGRFFFSEPQQKRVILAGDPKGVKRIRELVEREMDYPVEIIGAVMDDGSTASSIGIDVLGTYDQLGEIGRFYRADEVIFDNKSLSTEKIIAMMEEIAAFDLEYKIVPPDAEYIVGPQVIHTSRHGKQIRYNLQAPGAKIRKNLFDVATSGALLLSYPLLFWRYKKPLKALGNLFQVLTRRVHMVGYIHSEDPNLPDIKPGLLTMLNRAESRKASALNTHGLDKFYARTYSWELDLEILAKGWRRIGEESVRL